MRSSSPLGSPRAVLVGLAALVLVVMLFAASTSMASLSVFNSGWDGSSALQSQAEQVGSDREVEHARPVLVVLEPAGHLEGRPVAIAQHANGIIVLDLSDPRRIGIRAAHAVPGIRGSGLVGDRLDGRLHALAEVLQHARADQRAPDAAMLRERPVRDDHGQPLAGLPQRRAQRPGA